MQAEGSTNIQASLPQPNRSRTIYDVLPPREKGWVPFSENNPRQLGIEASTAGKEVVAEPSTSSGVANKTNSKSPFKDTSNHPQSDRRARGSTQPAYPKASAIERHLKETDVVAYELYTDLVAIQKFLQSNPDGKPIVYWDREAMDEWLNFVEEQPVEKEDDRIIPQYKPPDSFNEFHAWLGDELDPPLFLGRKEDWQELMLTSERFPF